MVRLLGFFDFETCPTESLFRNETCASWSNVQKNYYYRAKNYLKDRRKELDTMKSIQGYKTCYHIESLDATKCAKDCKDMQNGKFAKNCTENGGLFKCCIRRDKIACHKCQFCCTLPMCTYPPGDRDDTIFDIEHKLELKNQKNKLTADGIFFSDQPVHLSDDYHCVKPDSHEDPKKWHKYEAVGFRKAFNKKMLENVKTFKYDKYLYNFYDPKIFSTFTKRGKKASKIRKKSFHFHYMQSVPGDESSQHISSNGSWTNMTKCVKKCIKMERSKFARKCGKDGGLFKCCVTRWYLHEFEDFYNRLIHDGLINGTATNICDKKSRKDRCLYCRAGGMCTKKNPLTGIITHSYYPKMKKEAKRK